MQTESKGGIRGLFQDILDGASELVKIRVVKEANEIFGEQAEGPTEFANPNTVSQPVTPSQLPSGQPLNGFANRLGVSPTVVIVGGVAVVMLGSLFLFKVIGGK